MLTISSKVTELEHKTILEYANCCGLSVSELIRRVLMNQILFINGDDEASQYEFSPNFTDDHKEDKAFENFVNSFRKLLGIRPL